LAFGAPYLKHRGDAFGSDVNGIVAHAIPALASATQNAARAGRAGDGNTGVFCLCQRRDARQHSLLCHRLEEVLWIDGECDS
jgi:hypothetical protein